MFTHEVPASGLRVNGFVPEPGGQTWSLRGVEHGSFIFVAGNPAPAHGDIATVTLFDQFNIHHSDTVKVGSIENVS